MKSSNILFKLIKAEFINENSDWKNIYGYSKNNQQIFIETNSDIIFNCCCIGNSIRLSFLIYKIDPKKSKIECETARGGSDIEYVQYNQETVCNNNSKRIDPTTISRKTACMQGQYTDMMPPKNENNLEKEIDNYSFKKNPLTSSDPQFRKNESIIDELKSTIDKIVVYGIPIYQMPSSELVFLKRPLNY